MYQKREHSRAQMKFLRTFVECTAGPATTDWPSPAILRRWLRRKSFRSALKSLQKTWQIQSDLHLASLSTSTTGLLQSALDQPEAFRDPLSHLTNLLRLLHLSHQHRRFLHATSSLPHPVTPHPVTSQSPPRRYIHPSVSDEKADELIESLQANFDESTPREKPTPATGSFSP